MSTPPPLLYFKVVVAPANGSKIAGKRRALNEVFQAPERQVRFLVIEGTIVPTDAAGLPIGTGASAGSGGTGQADFSNPDNSGLAPLV